MSVAVKGVWERDRLQIYAKQVLVTVRLVSIEVQGALTLVSSSGLSLVANGGVIYSIDITAAKLQNQSGKTAYIGQFVPGQIVKIKGKHISGKNQIVGSVVKNTSLQ